MKNDPGQFRATERFNNRSENYVKYRPPYPPVLYTFFEAELSLTKEGTIADIGSGTGLFSLPLLKQGYRIICVEPNQEMRTTAEQQLSQYPGFTSCAGSAEATGLPPKSIDLLVVAQAFHWMDAEGEVIHVIVKRCYNFSKLLRNLTPSQNENLPLLTLSHSDEKSIPPHAQNKRSQVRQVAQEKVSPEARNFK